MIDFNFLGEDPFEENLFITTRDTKRIIFKLEKSIEKLKENNILPEDNESIRCISPAGGFSSCSVLCAIADKVNITDILITTLRVGQKELDKLIELKVPNIHIILSGIAKHNTKGYDYDRHFEKLCKEHNITYDYVNNHSKVILINSKEGKYVIETSSNFNENPKIEQFIITRSAEVYDYYITTFEKIGVVKGGIK